MTAPAAALTVNDVARRFGPVSALRGVSFSLSPGDLLAVVGRNGAGKTTLLRLLAGLLRPDRGEILLSGRRFDRSDSAQRRRIGLISHASLCYDGLTALENLEFFARLYGLDQPRLRAAAALEAAGLADKAAAPASTMSRGMLQRLSIARALMPDPELVLLDEPFTGLDRASAAALAAELLRLRGAGRVLVMVTHDLGERLELASQVGLLEGGRFVEYGPPAAVAAAVAR